MIEKLKVGPTNENCFYDSDLCNGVIDIFQLKCREKTSLTSKKVGIH